MGWSVGQAGNASFRANLKGLFGGVMALTLMSIALDLRR